MRYTGNYGLRVPEASDYLTPEDNNAEAIDEALNALLTAKADLDASTGKVPEEQLPEMNYDPAGTAAGALEGAKTYADGQIASHDSSADAHSSLLTGKASAAALAAHTEDKGNPHAVTKAQVGLGNADDTADAAKPVSTAVQAALDGKAARMQWTDIDVPTSAWTQDDADNYYYASVSVPDMLAADDPHSVDIVRSSDAAADALCDEAFGMVDRIVTQAGGIILRAPDGKPSVAFKLWMEAAR